MAGKVDAYELQNRIEAHLLEKADAFFKALRLVQRNGDSDAVHLARVNSRRLRVGLRFFAELFPEGEARQVRRQLRRAARELGEIRALDVNVALLRSVRRSWGVRVDVVQALLHERANKLKVFQELAQVLLSSRWDSRTEALIEYQKKQVDSKRLLRTAKDQLEQMRKALRRRYKKFCKSDRGRDFHQFRIAGKRYRYALEVCEAVFFVPIQARIKAMKKLQDLLGQCHDEEVLCAFLKSAKLSEPARNMITFFEQEQKQRYEECQKFLREENKWSKKVRLELNHE